MERLGKVEEVIGGVVESRGPAAELGEICKIGKTVLGEVVGFRGERVVLMPYGELKHVFAGSEVMVLGKGLEISLGDFLLGRVLDGLGYPMDGKPLEEGKTSYSIYQNSPSPMERKRITQALSTGIRSIDALLTVGLGQKLGIFSGTGVGKSTLLGMIARNSSADVNVIALVGERSREVRDFIEKDLGDEGLARSVLVVSTSDTPSLMRVRAPFLATTIAEYFRDQGKNVLLIMDSITRFARAQREVGLSLGEAPALRGFPPSVYTMIPRLVERTGSFAKGSITAFYSVLVEGDDLNEPVSDNVRGVLDGHIVLSRDLANRGYYPAVDILESVSRISIDLVSHKTYECVLKLREILSHYRDAQDLILIGAYVSGSNPKVDYALSMLPKIEELFRQNVEEHSSLEEALRGFYALFGETDFQLQQALCA